MKVNAGLVACLLAAFAAGGLLIVGVRPTPAQDAPRAAAPEAGRYQVITRQGGVPYFLVDTATGRMWSWAPEADDRRGQWVESTGPPKAK